MLSVEMLPAGHGDALVIEYGSRSHTSRLLVDAGTASSYDAVRARLLSMPDVAYEAFVVTHVDEDHIGGAVPLLKDPDLRSRVKNVWFNGYVHCEGGGNVLGPVDGERLTLLIARGGLNWNKPFDHPVAASVGGPVVVPGHGDLPRIPLPGGAILHLLAPSGAALKKMTEVWERAVVEADLVAGMGTDRPARVPRPKRKNVAAPPTALTAEELRKMAAPSERDDSVANATSIAFLLEYKGKRVLLTGDAHSDVLTESLARFGRAYGEARVRVDICKLPHHGSAANVTTAFIEAIDAQRYLVSSNGDNYGHPDDAAIARVLVSSARPPLIYGNYASDRMRGWVAPAASAGASIILPREGRTGFRVSAT